MQYEILTSGAGIRGEFTDVIDNLPFLNGQLIYNSNTLMLELVRGTTPYVDVAQTRNQQTTAVYLDQLWDSARGDLQTVMQNLDSLSAPDARAAFDQLAGETYANVAEIDIAVTNLFVDTAFYRMENNGNLDCDAPMGRQLWGYALGQWQQANGNRSYYGYSGDINGFLVGYDKQYDDILLGCGSGYAHANERSTGLPDRTESDLIHVDAYAKKQHGAAYVCGIAGYTHGWNDVTRSIECGSLAKRKAVGAMPGHLLGTRFETGYNIKVNRWQITPIAGLRYVYGNMDSVVEAGADSVDLAVAGYQRYSLMSNFGARLAFCAGKKWRAECYGQWEHEYGDAYSITTMNFVGSSGNYLVQGVPVGRDGAHTGIVIRGDLSDRLSVNLNYDALMMPNYSTQQLAGGMSWGF